MDPRDTTIANLRAKVADLQKRLDPCKHGIEPEIFTTCEECVAEAMRSWVDQEKEVPNGRKH